MSVNPIVINGRAAVRSKISGVERWTWEMVRRLPELSSKYRVILPPKYLAHRAGHIWEQFVLPAQASLIKAKLIYSPANIAPLYWKNNVVLIHDAAALRFPYWYVVDHSFRKSKV